VCHRRPPLNVSTIGVSLHSHLAVRPWLRRRPLHAVVAILDVVVERLPAALRFMTPAHILEDEYIAAAGEEQRLLIGTRITLRAVRRAGEQYRKFAILGGAVNLGVELRAIAHRHGDLVILLL